MLQFQLTSASFGCIWIGELPNARYTSDSALTQTIEAMPSLEINSGCAAIELRRHSCGPSSYALLGAEFISATSNALTVSVIVSTDTPPLFTDAYAYTGKEIRVGLPKEYGATVFKIALSLPELVSLGCGTLTFHCAAYSDVGSSPYLFALATRGVMRLLLLNREPRSQDELKRILS